MFTMLAPVAENRTVGGPARARRRGELGNRRPLYGGQLSSPPYSGRRFANFQRQRCPAGPREKRVLCADTGHTPRIRPRPRLAPPRLEAELTFANRPRLLVGQALFISNVRISHWLLPLNPNPPTSLTSLHPDSTQPVLRLARARRVPRRARHTVARRSRRTIGPSGARQTACT
jgi:hypothetical protein